MQLEEARFMELQFAQREKEAKVTKEMLKQIQLQMEQLKLKNAEKESLLVKNFEILGKKVCELTVLQQESSLARADKSKLIGKNP